MGLLGIPKRGFTDRRDPGSFHLHGRGLKRHEMPKPFPPPHIRRPNLNNVSGSISVSAFTGCNHCLHLSLRSKSQLLARNINSARLSSPHEILSLPCLAVPCLATPCQAVPCPVKFYPCLVLRCQAPPRPAVPSPVKFTSHKKFQAFLYCQRSVLCRLDLLRNLFPYLVPRSLLDNPEYRHGHIVSYSRLVAQRAEVIH